MNNFFRRTLTGAGIVIFVLGGFWLHPVSFFITGLVLMAGTQYEFYNIIGNRGVRTQNRSGIVTGVFMYTLSTLIASGLLREKYMLLVIPLLLMIMIAELYRKLENPFDSLSYTVFGLLYTVLPFSLFPFAAFKHEGIASLLSHPDIVFSPGLIIGFFLLVWINDTGAYLTGMAFGKHKLFERISPKKTWEGFIGGLIFSMTAAWLLSGWLGVTGKIQWVIAGMVISIIGTYGDLVESMLKRSTGVKDSGSILPGHGGFLDRFDSTIAAFPVVFILMILF